MIKVMMVFKDLDDMRSQLGFASQETATQVASATEDKPKRTRKKKATPKTSTVDSTPEPEAELPKVESSDDLPDNHLLKELRTALTKASDRTTIDDVWDLLKPFDGAKVAKDIPPAKRQEVIDLAEKLGA